MRGAAVRELWLSLNVIAVSHAVGLNAAGAKPPLAQSSPSADFLRASFAAGWVAACTACSLPIETWV
jgi:hypothetical protein